MRLILPLLAIVSLAAGETTPADLTSVGVPTQVSRNSNLWFEDGKMRGGQDTLQIGLHAVLPERLRISEVVSVELLTATSEDGSQLVASEHGAGGGSGGEPGTVELSIMLTPPPMQVRRIGTLSIAVQARIAAEGLRRATMKPAKSWIAKRLRIDGFTGAEIELEDLGAERLTLGLTPILAQALENLAFRTAAGTEIEHQGWNDTQEPGWVVRQVDIALPADGEIILDLRQELGLRRIVVTAKDIPIALPDRSKPVAGVLPTTDVQGDAVEAPPQVEIVPLPAPAQPRF
jgi:hypothetical protein